VPRLECYTEQWLFQVDTNHLFPQRITDVTPENEPRQTWFFADQADPTMELPNYAEDTEAQTGAWSKCVAK